MPTPGIKEVNFLLKSLFDARMIKILERRSEIPSAGGGQEVTKKYKAAVMRELKDQTDIEALEREGVAVAQKTVIKENLWERKSIEAMAEEKDGNIGFAIYYKYLYDSIPSKPPNNPLARALFSDIIFKVKNAIEENDILNDLELNLDKIFAKYRNEKIEYNNELVSKSWLIKKLFWTRLYNSLTIRSLTAAREIFGTARTIESLWHGNVDSQKRAQHYFDAYLEKIGESREKSPDSILDHFKDTFEEHRKGLLKQFATFQENRFPALKGEKVVLELQSAFGFRGIQFGNYVSDEERESHVRLTYGAFFDLATVLHMDVHSISLGNRLAIGFGAAGAGKAMAHYDPSNEFINLTKKRGNGALAHEWAHFLDFSLFGASYLVGKTNIKKKPASGLKLRGGNLDDEVQRLWNDIAYMIVNSQFRKRSKAFGSYWAKQTECFARAFESFISDRVENPYLVLPTVNPKFDNKHNHYWDKDVLMRPDAHYFVYPQGDERKEINDTFNAFFLGLLGKWDNLFKNISLH